MFMPNAEDTQDDWKNTNPLPDQDFIENK